MAINPKIKQKAEDIRKKIFGSEVRESLASGIEAISEDVEATIGRQDYVEEQFQNVIDETTDKDVISAPELIAARNGKSNLKTRLDDEHEQVTAQLQQTVKKGETGTLDLNVFNEQTRAIIQGLEAGQINAVLGYRNVKKENIDDGAVDYDQLRFMSKGINMIDPNKVVEGEFASQSNGQITLNPAFKRTERVMVKSGLSYVYSNSAKAYSNSRYAFFNTDGIFKKGSLLATTQVITTEEDGYIIVSDSPLNRMMQLEIGTVATTFESFRRDFKDDFKELLNQDKGLPNGLATLDSIGKVPLNQIPDVSEKIEHVDAEQLTILEHGKNYIDNDLLINGEYVSQTDGEILYNENFWRTPYIPIDVGDFIFSNRGRAYNSSRFAFFDKDMNFKKGSLLAESQLIKITEKGYIMFSDGLSRNEMQLEKNTTPTPYEKFYYQVKPEAKIKTTKVKTIIFTGDSIPYGTSPVSENSPGYVVAGVDNYPAIVAKEMNLNLKNYSIGGSTIGLWGQGGAEPRDRTPIIQRYQEMSNEADVIVVAAGSNDWAYSWSPLGDMSSRENTTFYGALHNLCLGLIEKYPAKLIVFCTPIKRKINESIANPEDTKGGYTLKQYVEAIKEVCDYYSIPVLDFYSESMINPYIPSQAELLVPDFVHPNVLGHKVMARRFIAYLNSMFG